MTSADAASPENASAAIRQQVARLVASGRHAEAETLARRALTLAPDDPAALFDLALVLGKLEHYDESIALYRRVILLTPDKPAARLNLGAIHDIRGEHDVAATLYEEAVQCAPDLPIARFYRSLARLRNGDFAQGWADYEYRPLKVEVADHFAQLGIERWRGEPLTGRSLLLVAEQGAGDSIQFVRYAMLLKAQGASRIGVLSMRGMDDLLRTAKGVDEVLIDGGYEHYDAWMPIMSAPLRAATTLESIPADIPYLQADNARVARWAQRLSRLPATDMRVGLVWAGNASNTRDAWRSASIGALAPLFAVPGIAWVSLQKGAAQSQLSALPAGAFVHAMGDYLGDYAETAAVISQLDLVITVDTSVAHLAGALGKPVWILLAGNAEWRWLSERQDSPWYPTARLFRQRLLGQWEPLAATIAQALQKEICSRRAQRMIAALDDGEALRALGALLVKAQRAQESLFFLERASARDPGRFEVWFYLGLARELQGRFDHAADCYRHALTIERRSAALVNLAGCLEFEERYDQALSLHLEALKLSPQLGQAGLGAAHIHLRRGQFEEGWRYYEHRRNIANRNSWNAVSCPAWRGEPLQGKRLLLVGEQGFGDVIQAVRYAQLIAARGPACIDVLVPLGMQTLIAKAHGVDTAQTSVHASAYDYHAHIMSLPGLMGTRAGSIPAFARYIDADIVKVQHWRSRIDEAAAGRRRVGIVWAGRPTHERDAVRSIPLQALAPLWSVPDLAWFSLQKGPAEEALQADTMPASLTHLGGALRDFSDTAAVIENLDLVVCVDTSVAHLAGALGKPVWILLARNPDWRWMDERSDSPWYPTARLFRQRQLGDWRAVLDDVVSALRTLQPVRALTDARP
ncbi:tetratricopeptide repeat protein [Uliginosibacterium sp. sgz301328]|uniref:tetratricopeptide repeat protein n=1 Tax=Uliginosibacterium sp. sgz301328 TaxID=3243764 RepID=UPI00359E6661